MTEKDTQAIERIESPPEQSETAIRACLAAVNADPKPLPFDQIRRRHPRRPRPPFRLKTLDSASAEPCDSLSQPSFASSSWLHIETR